MLRGFRDIPSCVREELAQEATLRTFLARGVRDERAYVRRVGVRLGIDWLRRAREEAGRADAPEPSSWAARAEARMDLVAMQRILSGAPEPHRSTLEELVVGGCSVEEATRAWGCDRDAVYKRRRRAIAWVRQALG